MKTTIYSSSHENIKEIGFNYYITKSLRGYFFKKVADDD